MPIATAWLTGALPWNPPPFTEAAPWTLVPRAEGRWPNTVLLIASTPRSGSSLLCRGLEANGHVGAAREYFEMGMISRHRVEWGVPRLTLRGRAGAVKRRIAGHPSWWDSPRYTTSSMEAYRDGLVAAVTSPTGWFPVKIHFRAYELLRGGPWDPLAWGIPVRWVHIRRNDILRQAVSLIRARQTGAWSSTARARKPPHFDRDGITSAIDELRRSEVGWSALFAAQGVEPIEVVYEVLAANYQSEVDRVAGELGLPAAEIPSPPLARQADELSEEWVSRYLASTEGFAV